MTCPRPQRVSKSKKLKTACWISLTFSSWTRRQFFVSHLSATHCNSSSGCIGMTLDLHWHNWGQKQTLLILPSLPRYLAWLLSQYLPCSPLQWYDMSAFRKFPVSSFTLVCVCAGYRGNFPLSWSSITLINHCVTGWELFYLVNATIPNRMNFISFHMFTCVSHCK